MKKINNRNAKILNKTKNGYCISIKSDNITNYYFVKKKQNEIVKIGRCPKPNSIIKPKIIEWDQIPIEIRKMDYKNRFKKAADDLSQCSRYVYGENSEKVIEFENWLSNQRYFPIHIANSLYKKIGIFQSFEVLYDSPRGGEYFVNEKYYILLNRENQTYLITDDRGNKKAIIKRAKAADVSIDMACITRTIENDEEAVKLLVRLKNLNQPQILELFKKYNDCSERKSNKMAKKYYNDIIAELKKIFGTKSVNQMDLSKCNFKALSRNLSKK